MTIASMLATACSGRGASSDQLPHEPLAESCRVNVARRQAPLETATSGGDSRDPTSLLEGRPSRLVAVIDLKLAPLKTALDAKVPPRLAEERNKTIGIAGHLNYTVDRGPLAVAVEGESLVLRTDIRARAEACRGNACYASCEPRGRATATVPLRLGPDYQFAPSRVAFAFDRGCEVRALGGLVKVDVTPTIQGELGPALRRVEREIDQNLRDQSMRAQAERLWAEMSKTRPLPLGACVVTNPRGIVQGPASGGGESARAMFGVLAYPEIRTKCGEPAAPRPLPPLGRQPELPPSDELLVGLVSPLARVASSLESAEAFDAGGARTRASHVVASSAGSRAQLEISLRGEACGDVAVRSAFEWTTDGRALRPVAPAFVAGERERAALSSLGPDALLRGFITTMRAPPPVAVESLKELVPSIVQGLSDPSVDVRAVVDDVKPTVAVVRGDDLVAVVALRGHVQITQR